MTTAVQGCKLYTVAQAGGAGNQFRLSDDTNTRVMADWVTGTIYAAFYEESTDDVYVAMSYDQGKTWVYQKVFDCPGGETRSPLGGPSIWIHSTNRTVHISYATLNASDDDRYYHIHNDTVDGEWTDDAMSIISDASNHRYLGKSPVIMDIWTGSEHRLVYLTRSSDTTYASGYIYSATRNEATKAWGSWVKSSGNIHGSMVGASETYGYASYTRLEDSDRFICVIGNYKATTAVIYYSTDGASTFVAGSSFRTPDGVSTWYMKRVRVMSLPDDTNPSWHYTYVCPPDAVTQGKRAQYGRHWWCAMEGFNMNPAWLGSYSHSRSIHCPEPINTLGAYAGDMSYSHDMGYLAFYAVFGRVLIPGGNTTIFWKVVDKAEGASASDWEYDCVLPEPATQVIDFGSDAHENHPGEDKSYHWDETEQNLDTETTQLDLLYHSDKIRHVVQRGFAGITTQGNTILFFTSPDFIFTKNHEIGLTFEADIKSYITALKRDHITGDCDTGCTSSTIKEATLTYRVNELQGQTIQITSGTYAGEESKILSNTATDIILEVPLSGAPAENDTYVFIDIDPFTLSPLFDNLYPLYYPDEDVYIPIKYVNNSGQSLTSVVITPTCEWGTIEINTTGGISDDGVDEAALLTFASARTESSWADGAAIYIWFKWVNSGTPEYGEQRIKVDFTVTE